MSKMTERVARAICNTYELGGRDMSDEMAAMLARAAIEAMREPTSNMVEDANDARWREHERNPSSESNPCPGEPDGEAYWRIMIDSALR